MAIPTKDDIFLSTKGELEALTQERYSNYALITNLLKTTSSVFGDMYEYVEKKLQNTFFLENLTFDELQNFGSKLNKPLLQGTFSSGNALFFSATAGIDVPVNSNLYINDSVYITTTYGYTTQQNILCNATRVNTIATIKSSTSLNIPTGSVVNITGFTETNFNQNNVSVVAIDEYTLQYEVQNTGLTSDSNGYVSFIGAFVNVKSNDTGLATELTNGTLLAHSIPNITSVLTSFNGITGGTDQETQTAYLQRVKNVFLNRYRSDSRKNIISTIQSFNNTITQGVYYNDYNYTLPIKSITKDPTINNDYQRKIECEIPHKLRNLTYFKKIYGSSKASLNIASNNSNNRAISKIYDDYSFLINVPNTVDEDSTSSNMNIEMSGFKTALVLYKGNSAIKTLTQEEINAIYTYLETEELSFDSPSNSYIIFSATQDIKSIVISNLYPKTSTLINNIKNNIFDYVNTMAKIGQPIKKSQIESIIENTTDNNNIAVQSFTTNLTSDLVPTSSFHIISVPKNNITII